MGVSEPLPWEDTEGPRRRQGLQKPPRRPSGARPALCDPGLRLGPGTPVTWLWRCRVSAPTSEKWRCLRVAGGLGTPRERPAHVGPRGAALLPDRPASWGGWAPGAAAPSPAQEARASAGHPRRRRAVGSVERSSQAGVEASVFHDRAGRRPLSLRSGVAQNETSITSFPVEEKPPQPARGLGGPPCPQDSRGAGGVSSGIPPLPASPPLLPGPAPRRCWDDSGALSEREAVVPGSPRRALER